MPTLSASDYTTYLKYKAAASSPIRPDIQTRTNATLSQSVLNANLLTSQAAYVVTPSTSTVVTLPAVVTDASTTTVTDALTNVLDTATADGAVLTYTSSQAHGLANGNIVTITGFTGTLVPDPNVSNAVVTVVNATTFTVPAAVATSGTATGTGSITGRVYYTTSVANGLLAGDVISITGITTFTASDRTVLAAPTTTTFVLSSTVTGTGVTGETGSITGLVYYTTDVNHGAYPGQKNLSISGLSTASYNLALFTVYRVPTSNVFIVQSVSTGTAVTGASGVLTESFFGNPTTSITGLNYVRARPVVQTRSNPEALSTLSFAGMSGAKSSSATQQPGGLPTGFKGSQGSYHRLPQNAGWIQGNMVSSGPKRF